MSATSLSFMRNAFSLWSKALIDTIVIRSPFDGSLADCDQGIDKIIVTSRVTRYEKHVNTDKFQLTLRSVGGDPTTAFLQMSLPKLLHGHNAAILNVKGICEALDSGYARVVRTIGEERLLPLAEWGLTRIDWCYDWIVQSPEFYVQAVNRSFSRRRDHQSRMIRGARREGVTFGSGCRDLKLRLYDKQAEVGARVGATELEREAARGRLRFEVETKGSAIKRSISPAPKTVAGLIRSITDEPNRFIASQWATVTRDMTLGSYATAFEKITERYGQSTKARRLMDMWLHINEVGLDCYRERFDLTPATYYRYIGEMRDLSLGWGLDGDHGMITIGEAAP